MGKTVPEKHTQDVIGVVSSFLAAENNGAWFKCLCVCIFPLSVFLVSPITNLTVTVEKDYLDNTVS